MPEPNEFVAFALDQLSEIEHITAKPMFGGTLESPHDLADWARRAIEAADAAERQRRTRPRGRHVTHARGTRSNPRARN